MCMYHFNETLYMTLNVCVCVCVCVCTCVRACVQCVQCGVRQCVHVAVSTNATLCLLVSQDNIAIAKPNPSISLLGLPVYCIVT
jgi:hypothetical protein